MKICEALSALIGGLEIALDVTGFIGILMSSKNDETNTNNATTTLVFLGLGTVIFTGLYGVSLYGLWKKNSSYLVGMMVWLVVVAFGGIYLTITVLGDPDSTTLSTVTAIGTLALFCVHEGVLILTFRYYRKRTPIDSTSGVIYVNYSSNLPYPGFQPSHNFHQDIIIDESILHSSTDYASDHGIYDN